MLAKDVLTVKVYWFSVKWNFVARKLASSEPIFYEFF